MTEKEIKILDDIQSRRDNKELYQRAKLKTKVIPTQSFLMLEAATSNLPDESQKQFFNFCKEKLIYIFNLEILTIEDELNKLIQQLKEEVKK